MDKRCAIRRRVLPEGVRIRQIQREAGLHVNTIKRILTHAEPPAFLCPERPKPKIGPFLERIAAILESDKSMLKKQRHIAKRIFEVIAAEGYSGGYTAVKDAVRELRRTSQEVFVPLVHRPGEALVKMGRFMDRLEAQMTA